MKLTTKMLLLFVLASSVAVAWLLIFAVPSVRGYLGERETHYAKSYLEMAADETRGWLMALAEVERELSGDAKTTDSVLGPLTMEEESGLGLTGEEGGARERARKRLFKRLNDRFNRFYFHQSGRLFVINSQGEFVIYSDPIMRGRMISNRFLFEDGNRNRLIQQIVHNRGEFMQEYSVQEVAENQEVSNKQLFVKFLVGTDYFVCISVNTEDLYYSANLAAQALTIMVVVILLAVFLLWNFFYLRLRQRFDQIVECANLVEHGNYDIAINDRAKDELGVLAGIIDKLAADMRQKHQLESQLRQAQKMEMVGTLASGIAHDFNNILAGITSSLDLIKRELSDPSHRGRLDMELLNTSLNIAGDCALRARDTVARMLSFSRVSEKDMRLLDLNRIMHNIQQICKSSFDKRVQVQVEPLATPAVARADRSQLEQAILNVCINARDAMPGGGRLTLKVEQVPSGAHNPHLNIHHEAPYYRLVIEDNGCGIDPAIVPRIFEPFFTTKQRGSGLGLPMVYKIAEEHGGWVAVDSQVGMGSKFHLYLPCMTEPLPPEVALELAGDYAASGPGKSTNPTAGPKPPPVMPDLRGTGTILVVDDESHMLRLTQDILARLGYSPMGAISGQEAIATFTTHAETIDAVVLDLLLPEMSGAEVFDAIRKLRPGIKVLLISGAKRDPRIGDLLARGCDGFLQKPFTMDDLGSAMRQLLAHEPL